MDQFSYIANADVAALDALYQQYKENPTSVDESWQNFFKGFEFNQTFNANGASASVHSSPTATK